MAGRYLRSAEREYHSIARSLLSSGVVDAGDHELGFGVSADGGHGQGFALILVHLNVRKGGEEAAELAQYGAQGAVRILFPLRASSSLAYFPSPHFVDTNCAKALRHQAVILLRLRMFTSSQFPYRPISPFAVTILSA